ncbi:MAG: hypothetical protein AUK54_02090 [Helicobacteraceae bacterium CG2_30_36_10]|nr:MAG: hypothetical protein AUK54_02090 [Helicobacteraceae bacterium CG2_30_36_10]
MKFYHSKLLNSASNVTHAFTTRHSGNLAFHVNDNPRHVQMNHERLAKELGYKKESLIYMKQIHSNLVHIVNDEDNFLMCPSEATNTLGVPRSCDALITDKADTPLMVMAADCAPLLFYDQRQKVIAVAHAGREGTFKNIVGNVCERMACGFDSKPEDISVSIGANIGVCCYEVGGEIYEEAKALQLEYAVQKKDKRYYLDINKIIKTQLLACGIKEEKIEFCDECTCCKKDKYFSYRAEKTTGRFCGVIILKVFQTQPQERAYF